jgi:hypothetical protein
MNGIAWRRNSVGVAVWAVAAIAFALVLSGPYSFMPLVLRPVREFSSRVQKLPASPGTETATMFELSPLARLCVMQAAGQNPDIRGHHRNNAKYN